MGKLVKCNNCDTEYDLDVDNRCPNCDSNDFRRDSVEKAYKKKSDDD